MINSFQKSATEKFDVGFDWSSWLKSGEELIGSEWSVVSGSIEINGESQSEVVNGLPPHGFMAEGFTSVWLKGGVEGSRSEIRNQVTTSMGRVWDNTLLATIKDYTNPATAGRYCTLADVQNIFGRTNVDAWARIEDVPDGEVDARIVGFIADAEDYVDSRLMGTRYEVPFVDPVPRVISRVAAQLAGVYLYEARGAKDANAEGNPVHRYAGHKAWAFDRLNEIRDGSLQLDAGNAAAGFPVVVDIERDTEPDAVPQFFYEQE